MSNYRPAHLARLLGTFWTFANMLSLIRLVLAVPVMYLIMVDGPMTLIFGLILLAVATDWFDGRVARWSHTVSDWGKVLDPLADKAAAAMVTLALVVRGTLPAWFLGIVLARDALIVLGGIVLARRTAQVMMSLWIGKVAVASLSLTVLAALLRADPPVLAFCVWTTTTLLLLAFLRYCARFLNLYHRGAAAPAMGQEEITSVTAVNREARSIG